MLAALAQHALARVDGERAPVVARRGKDGRQLELFGEPEPTRRARAGRGARRVGPAEVPERVRRIAGELPPGVRLGTSSWSFPGWHGSVYDRRASAGHLARHGLAAYARHPLLRAVGIDRTYYAPVAAATLAAYAEVVPADFRFLVKAARLCTDPHERGERGRSVGRNDRFLDAAFAAGEVVASYVEGLGERGGALVFQFPPLGEVITREPERFADRLARFLADLPGGPVYVVELRDRRLLGDAYAAALVATGARHCFTAHPRMPSLARQREVVGPAGPLVGRWMLHGGLGYAAAQERYAPYSRIVDEDPDTRSALAELSVERIAAGGSVLVTANNKAEGSAPETLFRLAGRIVELFRDRSP